MSDKVWDKCTSCAGALQQSNKEWDWRECGRCKGWSVVLFVTALFGVVTVWTLAFCQMSALSRGRIVSLLGLSLDVIGAWLLAQGFAERMARAAGSWGGGGTSMDAMTANGTRRKNWGLFLILLGFLGQAFGGLI